MWDKMKLFGINVTFIIPGHIYFTVSANSTLKQSEASVVSTGINIRLDNTAQSCNYSCNTNIWFSKNYRLLRKEA